MSLAAFRDHCRKMAEAKHKPECPMLTAIAPSRLTPMYDTEGYIYAMAVNLEAAAWKPPHCDGCNSDKDRLLFKVLADEVDEYQSRQGELW